jgi:hypothetical protein
MTTPNSDVAEGILGILKGLASQHESETKTAYQTLSEDPALVTARNAAKSGNFGAFYHAVQYPVNNLLEGLLREELRDCHEVRFLFMQYRFLENHFKQVFVTYEGNGCSTDKARTLMRALLKFFSTGEEVHFNYSQEHTFHLPKRVLTTHASAIGFFNALVGLHFGTPTAYLQELLKLSATLEQATPSFPA